MGIRNSISSGIKEVKNFWFPVPGQNETKAEPLRQNDAHNLTRHALPLSPGRLRQDIASWRTAVKRSEQPYYGNRVDMQQMFFDTILNDHVQACMSKRKNLSLLKEFMLCGANDKEDVKATELLKNQWFFDLLSHILDAPAFGYSLSQLGNFSNNEFTNIQPIRRDLIVPDYRVAMGGDPYLASVPRMPDGIHFTNPQAKDKDGIVYWDWLIWATTPSNIGQSSVGNGYLYYVAKNEIYLRNNTAWNADYIEVYGQPLAVVHSPKKEDGLNGERSRLEQAVRDRGSNSYIILDLEDDVDFVTGKGASGKGNEVYDNFEERLQKGISKIILGHADAIESTPGKLGSQGGEKNGDAKDAASQALQEIETIDNRYVEHIINSQVLPKMIAIGLKIPLGLKFKFKNDKERRETQKEKIAFNLQVATVAKTMKEAGLKMDAKYFEDQTEIPCEQIEETTEDPFDGSDGKKFASDIKNKLELSFKH